MTTSGAGLSGRKAQAARNDQVILDAARMVFVANPAAPVAAVAKQAGVGISALYRRYPSKEELLRQLCADGLRRYIAVAEQALAERNDPWHCFVGFVRGIVDADVHSLTVSLAGTFEPTQELGELAEHANRLSARILRRAKNAGAVRTDFQLNDLPMLLEQMTAIRIGDADRVRQLRQRYLALQFDALRPPVGSKLPGHPPRDTELAERWTPR